MGWRKDRALDDIHNSRPICHRSQSHDTVPVSVLFQKAKHAQAGTNMADQQRTDNTTLTTVSLQNPVSLVRFQ